MPVRQGYGLVAGRHRPGGFERLPAPALRDVGRLVEAAPDPIGRRFDQGRDEPGGDRGAIGAHCGCARMWPPPPGASRSGLTAATGIPADTTAAAFPAWYRGFA